MDQFNAYDPDQELDAQAWLELDEEERIEWVAEFHTRAKIDLPNVTAHAVFHMMVENQVALGVECVVRAIPRLMAQGLSRHDAIHAVGSVYSDFVFKQLSGRGKGSGEAALKACYAAIDKLSAKAWLSKYGSN
jgi:hypothetical protein